MEERGGGRGVPAIGRSGRGQGAPVLGGVEGGPTGERTTATGSAGGGDGGRASAVTVEAQATGMAAGERRATSPAAGERGRRWEDRD